MVRCRAGGFDGLRMTSAGACGVACWAGLNGAGAGRMLVWRASKDQFGGEFGHGFPKKRNLSAMDFLAAGPVIKEWNLAWR